MKMSRTRIDKLLTDRGLAPSRERAQAFIMAGLVYVGEKKVLKPSEAYSSDVVIELRGKDHPYVSRGGVKLVGALDQFQIDVKGKVCLDVGASTGGFTDCLLQRGAAQVYALDVGYGQLAWKIRQDPRVVVIEKKNVRNLEPGELPSHIDFIVIDVSFISLTKVIPHLLEIFPQSLTVLALIKPQFELEAGEVPKGGVVVDEKKHQQVIEKIVREVEERGCEVTGSMPSSLKGADGNQEYFIFFRKDRKCLPRGQ
jgi:23S rRNA (cytidine1920-2'-O)/16S rRNA (cytidine1409-2'-O)-methyltransferase